MLTDKRNFIHKKSLMMSLSILLIILLAGCGSNQDRAAQSVEDYFQAIIEKNETFLLSKTCASYEMEALMDFNTFVMVETSMKDFSCQTAGEIDNQVQVRCQGSIRALFGDEIRSFDLSKRIYQMSEEDGTWLVCGHTDEN